MFENLLFQQNFVKTIENEITNGSLPQALLFYGDNYSGKLTAALELARVLNCEIDGSWQCQCKSCHQNRSMQHPYLLLTGTRYFNQEIKQSAEFLKTSKTKPSQFIFIRNVRKLIKRFSKELWDKDDNKFKKVASSLNKINDILYLLEPDRDLPEDKELIKTVDKIVTECLKLSSELPKGNIPINQIRNISSWVRRSVSKSKKIVILERADLMQDSSRNSLLKILEEPPKDTYFILISPKKNSVLPTILSRVRAYSFKSRSKGEQSLILEKLYKEKDIKSLREYFNNFSDTQNSEITQCAESYLKGMISGNESFSNILDIKIDPEVFNRFLMELTIQIRNSFIAGKLSISFVEELNKLIKESVSNQTYYNQSPTLLLENLYYKGQHIA